MKKIFLLFMAPIALLLLIMLTTEPDYIDASPEATPVHLMSAKSESVKESAQKQVTAKKVRKVTKDDSDQWYAASSNKTDVKQMIAYALSLEGSPYVYGGTSKDGFDCSGFTSHVFEEYGAPITRSSTTQSQDGVSVEREDARPGDLVIFTGTDMSVREPGHVGIVISSPGDTISFVHSSSNGGVKISQVEGTRYDDRFLDIRRVL